MPYVKKKKLAIFDIDGTIFRGCLQIELMKTLVYHKIFPKAAEKMVNKEYFAWVERRGTYQAYIEKVMKVFNQMIRGCKHKDIKRLSQRVANYFKDRKYVFTRDLIKKLKKEKYFLVAISGSPAEIVEEFNKHLKFDLAFGSIYEIDPRQKIYTGRVLESRLRNKDAVFDKFLDKTKITLRGSIGVGDTENDVGFLKLVERPIAFNPNANLAKIAKKNGWRIVVERKDVIYKIR